MAQNDTHLIDQCPNGGPAAARKKEQGNQKKIKKPWVPVRFAMFHPGSCDGIESSVLRLADISRQGPLDLQHPVAFTITRCNGLHSQLDLVKS
jgi:hypothetical protein